MERRYERFEVTSVDGMVAVVVQLISHGYRYFIEGNVGSNASKHDEVMIKRYFADAGKWERSHRKKRGLANFRYLRFENH